MAISEELHPEHAPGGHAEPHVVHHSNWPGFVGLASGALAIGLVIMFAMPMLGMFLIGASTIAWIYTTTRWWTEVSAKAAYERGGLDPAESMEYKNFRYGMLFFITSEIFFFIAFFEFYFGVRIQALTWPPAVGKYEIPLEFGAINTFILFASGMTMLIGHIGMIKGNRKLLTWMTLPTALMGTWFLAGQVWEYMELPFSIKDGVFGTAFYVLTGFHGFHVLVGVIFIWVVYFRSLAGHFTAERHFAVQACDWYWRFVDLIWLLIIFPLFYILPRFHV